MSTDQLKLLLAALEVEVVQEALELHVQTRPVPMDRRFEYRYRAAQSVLENLRQGTRELGIFPRRDDEEATLIDDQRSERRPLREQLDDGALRGVRLRVRCGGALRRVPQPIGSSQDLRRQVA